MARTVQVAIDCADPARLARFWAGVLDYRLQDPPSGYRTWSEFSRAEGGPGEEWHAVVDPAGVGPRILFHRVPEAKVMKNRVHLDVRVSGGPQAPMNERRAAVDAEVCRLVEAGATHVRTDDDGTDYFAVLRDPEGNEFCVN
jgi:catechol 2,3-dioxygenase-like lactoylglutathione lyase family enzyme